ncbi:PH domain-containing protein [Amnibacterium sp. CER49]|uniref:PH domain-containing protein n=1 Tax=Amnibacterium sp. CER49 TaxID=3039161 RepID=UPI00244B3DA4|nr:PH domain-containing protein [Amnibacterium sp. CER49]MDH2443092.1 PH domain-containing protein [Amnibacterium sp. CER49]
MAIGGTTRAAPARPERRPASPSSRETPEHVIVRLRRSARHLVWPSAAFLVLCFGTGYYWGRLPEPWLNAALPILAAVLVVACSGLPLLLWLNRITIITTRRLIVKHGFVVRERSEFLLGRGSEATLRRGPLQLLTGSGDVIVHAGADGQITLRDVPRARMVQRAVTDLIEQAAGTPLARRAG